MRLLPASLMQVALLALLSLMLSLSADAQPTICRNDTLILADPIPAAETDGRVLLVDLTRGMGYVGFIGAEIVSLNLSPFRRAATLSTAPYDQFITGAMDSAEGFAYFVTAITGVLVRITLTGPMAIGATLDMRAALSPPLAQAFFFTSALDPATLGAGTNTLAYFAEISGYLLKADLTAMTVVSTLFFPDTVPKFRCLAIDPIGRMLYAASSNPSSAAYIYRLTMEPFAVSATRTFTSLSFETCVAHPALGIAVFSSSFGVTESLLALPLAGPLTAAGQTLLLPPSDASVITAVLDAAAHRLLLATDIDGSSLSRVIDIDLVSFSRRGAVVMHPQEASFVSGALIPAVNNSLYFSRSTDRIVRVHHVPANCTGVATCGECNAMCGCGWCSGTQQCLPGDLTGDFAGRCPAGAWDVLDCATCSNASTCAVCTASPKCGWCNGANVCTRGAAAGPYAAALCAPAAWDFGTCPACSTAATCAACAAGDSRCGWCPESGTCDRGSAAAGSYARNCSSWAGSVCRVCTGATCAACGASPYCGLCAASGACLEGNATAPFVSSNGPASCPRAGAWNYAAQCPLCNHTSCDACTADSRCGWCDATQTCVQGDAVGAFTGACPAPAWSFGPGACPHCELRNASCALCAGDPGCGYCAATHRCLPGGPAGSYLAPACTGGWQYQAAGCAACSVLAGSCDGCAAAADCGFCGPAGACVVGNATADYNGVCAATPSSYFGAACPVCAGLDCAACAAAPECGYCHATQSCVLGSAAAPYAPTACPAGAYDGAVCRDCGARSCSSCQADSLCGHCFGDNACYAGSAAGAYGGACPGPQILWGYGGGVGCPDVCAAAGDCSACAADARCGWCHSTSRCEKGNDAGPFGSQCTLWDRACSRCASSANCSACVPDGGCGWCQQRGAAAGVCLPGDTDGALLAGACNGTGAWNFGDCDTAGKVPLCDLSQVAGGPSCSACLASKSCGWCPATRTCYVRGTGRCPRSLVTASCPGYSFVFALVCAVLLLIAVVLLLAAVLVAALLGERRFDSDEAKADRARYRAAMAARGAGGKGLRDDLLVLDAGQFESGQAETGTAGAAAAATAGAASPATGGGAGAGASAAAGGAGGARGGHGTPAGAASPASLTHTPAAATPADAAAAAAAAAGADAPDPCALDTSDPADMAAEAKAKASARRVRFELMPPAFRELAARDGSVPADLRRTLEDFAALITDPAHVIASTMAAVIPVTSDAADELARALVVAFEADAAANGGAAPLVVALARAEIAATVATQANTLLRSNSMASKAMTVHAQTVALRYLYDRVRPPLLAAMRCPERLAPDSAEVQPRHLISLCDAMLANLLASPAALPAPLRTVLASVMAAVEPTMPRLAVRVAASALFLRLVNPVVVSPLAFGLVDSTIDGVAPSDALATENALAVSKVLQAVASKAPFTTRNQQYAGANPFVHDGVRRLERFLAEVATHQSLRLPEGRLPPSRTQLTPSGESIDCEIIATPPSGIRDRALLALMDLAAEYEAPIRAALTELATRRAATERPVREQPFDVIKRAIQSGAPSFATLLDLLCAYNFALVCALCNVAKQDEHTDVCTALMLMLSAAQQQQQQEQPPQSQLQQDGVPVSSLCARVVAVLAERELRTAAESNMVFRSIHVAARMMQVHSSLVGSAYRRAVLAPFVARILAEPESLDTDTAHLPTEAALKANMFGLIDLVSSLLDGVFNSLDEVPLAMRAIAEAAMSAVADRFPDEWYLGPGRYFFTHFICEGLEHPQRHGLCAEAPSPAAQRVLHTVNRVIVHMVNDMLFAVEHRYVRALNEYVRQNVEVMRGFLAVLANAPSDAAAAGVAADLCFTPEETESASSYIISRLHYYADNATFVYLFHFHYYLERSGGELVDGIERSSEDEDVELEARALIELERLLSARQAVRR